MSQQYRKSLPNLLDELTKSMYVADSEIPDVHYAVDKDSVYIIAPNQALNIYRENIPFLIEELKQLMEVAP
jgi:hypothetical protein